MHYKKISKAQYIKKPKYQQARTVKYNVEAPERIQFHPTYGISSSPLIVVNIRIFIIDSYYSWNCGVKKSSLQSNRLSFTVTPKVQTKLNQTKQLNFSMGSNNI
jgi:hypothetical protein